MDIKKRNGQPEPYNSGKIRNAVCCAFESVGQDPGEEQLDCIMRLVEAKVQAAAANKDDLCVEQIQDMAEQALMETGCYETLKSFILYRNERAKERESCRELQGYFEEVPELSEVLGSVRKRWTDVRYRLEHLLVKFAAFYKPDMRTCLLYTSYADRRCGAQRIGAHTAGACSGYF